VEGRDDFARRADEDVRIVRFERPLDGCQDLCRRAGDGVAGDGQFSIDVVARFGHRNAEPERRQLARRRRVDAGLQTVPELRGKVDVEAGEIPDWIGRQLARLPGEWGDAVDVGDVDGENDLLVSSKASSSRNHFGRDDIRVLVVHGLERREVKDLLLVLDEDVRPPSITTDGARSVLQRLSEAAEIDIDHPKHDYLAPHGGRRGMGEVLVRAFGYTVAARYLDNSEEMVRGHYSHIEAGELGDVATEALEDVDQLER